MSIDWNNNQSDTDSHPDVELVKSEVGRRFPFYEMKYNAQTMAFFCRIDEETLEGNGLFVYEKAEGIELGQLLPEGDKESRQALLETMKKKSSLL